MALKNFKKHEKTILQQLKKKNKKFKQFIIDNDELIHLIVSMAYSFLGGLVPLSKCAKKKLKTRKRFLSKLAALDASIAEKRRLIGITPPTKLKDSIKTLVQLTKRGIQLKQIK